MVILLIYIFYLYAKAIQFPKFTFDSAMYLNVVVPLCIDVSYMTEICLS